MDIANKKLSPDLTRSLRENSQRQRTVTIRIAFSQDADAAAQILQALGMTIQSCGPGTVIATASRDAIQQACSHSWVLQIGTPQQLDKKLQMHKS